MSTGDLWVFVAGAVAIGALADWVRRATEQLAAKTSPAIGGLLSVSFGSVAATWFEGVLLLGVYAVRARVLLLGADRPRRFSGAAPRRATSPRAARARR